MKKPTQQTQANNDNLDQVQSLIGYKFNDSKYLDAAFTHSSYVNEHPAVGNERIEFLGDCVLNFLVGERLFLHDRTASEGGLSAKRASLVSRAPLARIVDELGLMQYLRVGAGVNKNAFAEKARSDIFEALLGAVYLDGGMDACRIVLEKIYYDFVTPERDYISELKNYSEEHGIYLFCYDICKDGDMFVAEMDALGKRFCAKGRSKHDAEKKLAETVYKALTEKKC
ncbi:MAG: hypothetical protein K2O04_08135 [Clostridiales bacterium]|nr:hypothetical protein [Clostridiales bacterium]